MTKADGYTIFCDDIRHEVGGKISLIGVYSADMFVHQPFPVTLPKLAFHVSYREGISAPLRDMVLCIFFPGDAADAPSYKAEISSANLTMPPLPPNAEPTEARRIFGLNASMSPVVLKEAGRIKVRMKVGDEVVKLGSLSVQYRQPQTTS